MTGALTGVRGAANGAAMVRPLRARPSVLTIVHVVMGRTLASRNGRVANFIRPLAAISSGPGKPGPSTGSGGVARGSTLLSRDSRMAPVTPSAAA